MPIEVKETSTPNETKLTISGVMDENGALPNKSSTSALRLNLEAVKGINSIGVRDFLRWGEAHQSVASILLENCPVIFVKNLSIVRDFLRPNMKVMSFYVPFYSEKTAEAKDVLFVFDEDFKSDGSYQMPLVKDSQGNEMTIDTEPTSFFRFLSL